VTVSRVESSPSDATVNAETDAAVDSAVERRERAAPPVLALEPKIEKGEDKEAEGSKVATQEALRRSHEPQSGVAEMSLKNIKRCTITGCEHRLS